MKTIIAFVCMIWCMMASASPDVNFGVHTELTQNAEYQYGADLDVGPVGIHVSGVGVGDYYLTARTQTDIDITDGVLFVPRLDINADYHTDQDGWYKSVYDRGRAHEYRYGYLNESHDGWYKSVYGRAMIYASPSDSMTVRLGGGYGFGQDNSEQIQLYAGLNYQYSDFNIDYGLNVRKYDDFGDMKFDRYIHEIQLTYTRYKIEPYLTVGFDGDNETHYDQYGFVGVQMYY